MRAVKRLANEREGEWEGVISHSSMYHRVFEGYSERQMPRENGKGVRIERVYIGDHYVRRGGAKAFRRAKLLYAGLYLAAALCAVVSFAQPAFCNSEWYGVIPMFALIVSLLVFAANLLSCLTAPREMELYHFNCFSRLITSALTIGIIAVGYALLTLICGALTGAWTGIALTSLFALLSAALLFTLSALERGTRYQILESRAEIASDAVVIS